MMEMNKYIIKIMVPILNKEYELFVPNNILVGNLLYMFIHSLKELDNIDIENGSLYDVDSDKVLNLDDYIFNSINNGATLIFV